MVFVLATVYKVTCFLICIIKEDNKVNTMEIRNKVFMLFGLSKLQIKSDRGEVNLFPSIQ